jgi:hypothetical protein
LRGDLLVRGAPLDLDPPAFRLPPATVLSPPADATVCKGWWRICHFY